MISRLPQLRLGLFFGAVPAYIVIFFLLYPARGTATAALSVVPVMVAGWFFGLRAALLSGILAFPMHVVLYGLVGAGGWQYIVHYGGLGSVTLILVGMVVGRLHDLEVKLRHELAQRKQAEKAWRESEEKYRGLYNDSPVMMHSIDHDGQLVSVSNHWLTTLGYEREEVIGRKSVEFLTPEARQYADEVILPEYYRTGICTNVPYQFVKKNGELMDILLSAIAVRDADGNFMRSLAVLIDVTKRKQAEQHLSDFQNRLKVLHEVSLELANADTFDDLCRMAVELGRSRLGFDRLSIWFVDDADPNYMVGSFGTDETGQLRDERGIRISLSTPGIFSEKARTGTVWKDTPLQNDRAEVVGHGWLAAATLWDGERIVGWISADNLLTQQSVSQQQVDLLKLYGVTLGNLCTRKRAEAALRASEERYRSLYRDNPSMFFTLDTSGRVISVNEFGASQLGYTVDELQDQPVLKVFHEADQAAVTEQLQTCLQHPGRVYIWQFRKVRKDGSVLWVEEYARVVNDPAGAPNVLVVCQDITERKQAEAQRLELALAHERAEAFRGFLNTLSHDLKTPLSVINTSLYLIERAADPHRRKLKLEQIKGQVKHLERLIQDILNASRLDTLPRLEVELLDLDRLIAEVGKQFETVAEDRRLALVLNLDQNLSPVLANEVELQRLIVNLVENALRYTPPEGMVSIRTFEQAGQAVVEVQDTGIGIDQADLPHIFEHFYRATQARDTDTGGTGLGLAIVKKITEMHGGSIEVESAMGEGSTFRVRLPLDQVSTNGYG